MREVGEKLRKRREELGYTLDEMSIRTKIQPHTLKAIEEGNMAFFEDDLSYLRYYLRFYCQALQIDFEEVREAFENNLNEFTETQSLKKIQDKEETQKSINKRIQDSRGKLKPEKRKIDYSLVSLIAVIAVIAAAVIFFAVKLGPSLFAPKEDQEPPVVDVLPSEDPSIEQEPSQTELPIVENNPLEVTTADGYTYEIRGWKENEQISIQVEFGRDTWMRVSYNGEVTDNPISKIYLPQETMEVLHNAEMDLVITLHFGALKDNRILINGEEIELDEKVRDLLRGQQLHFILKGE